VRFFALPVERSWGNVYEYFRADAILRGSLLAAFERGKPR
jgi:hypothetical protein